LIEIPHSDLFGATTICPKHHHHFSRWASSYAKTASAPAAPSKGHGLTLPHV